VPAGDPDLGVVLAAASTDFWLAVSLLSECCDRGLKAIAQLGAAAGTRHEMMLQCGVGLALLYSRGVTPDARMALTRARILAEALADIGCQLRAIYGLWLLALRGADFQECLVVACEYEVHARNADDPMAGTTADLILGVSRYCLGDPAAAADNLERAAASYQIAWRSSDVIRLGVDTQSITLCYQAVTFWSLGFAERASRAGREAIEAARAANHPVSLCLVLGMVSSILLVKIDDLEVAERYIDELIDHSDKHSLVTYHALGLCAKGSLMATRGDVVTADQLLSSGLTIMRGVALYFYYAFFLTEQAAVVASLGRHDEGIAQIEAAQQSAEQSHALWCMAEVLRIKGELFAKLTGGQADEAEAWLLRSLDLARRQQALSWELRAAMSLARYWGERGRAVDARDLLGQVYNRFTEGFDTADLVAAKQLLDALDHAGRD
jgi:non-specific serine/threonine protein kinase